LNPRLRNVLNNIKAPIKSPNCPLFASPNSFLSNMPVPKLIAMTALLRIKIVEKLLSNS
jgi:hypothetical protein